MIHENMYHFKHSIIQTFEQSRDKRQKNVVIMYISLPKIC